MKKEKEEKEEELKGENLLRDIYGQLLRVFDSYHCIKLHAKSLEAA